ncbi:Beta-14 N-acetylgalactosaminyltransferase 1 [Dissostichus eleginoides]|uniref:Beta-14 N-acetylgalactosaminyltransferase 1 n=1 Tax=Dissostichus eleginoides TaxID=100907 RepID=A0AAD9CQW1_DISEL|nr:Beta-14 N-acetylgalactosaminyltransferase 1 [Dissostichus eleginoides]
MKTYFISEIGTERPTFLHYQHKNLESSSFTANASHVQLGHRRSGWQRLIKQVLLTKPGGSDELKEYEEKGTISPATRKVMVNILVADMVQSEGRIPQRLTKEKYALRIVTRFPRSKIHMGRQDILLSPRHLPPPGPCKCAKSAIILKNSLFDAEEVEQRRHKEFQQHKARTESVLSTRLYAPSNSPLQYPIQGFKVRPMTSTFIPGLALHARQRSNYTVFLEVSKGVLKTVIPAGGAQVHGNGESRLMMESSSLETLNELLAYVSYTSTVYHIHTGDLASFQFEDHEGVFPITIKQPQPPVLYDMGTDINSQVTITTKTFLRYRELNRLLKSIRQFYKDIEVIIADDSFVTKKITGNHIKHFIMPPGKGWFAGRNLAASQVTTKYFLWVDDDFQFTKWTNIEEMVKIMEANPELDVEGDEMEGGCLNRKFKSRFQSLPGYPQCSVVSGVVNFFLARTDAAKRVRFDPQLNRIAHSEFFIDGLGSLMVATCGHVSIGHQRITNHKTKYWKFRHPGRGDRNSKLRHLFFKNNLKCLNL